MKLTLVTGPMFAGKTTYLIDSMEKHASEKRLLVTHKTDIRYSKGDELVNHNGKKLLHSVLRLETLDELPVIDKDTPTFIGIDEAQFFPDIVSYIRNLWKENYKNLSIVVCGLNGDFQQRPFGVEPNWISQLISISTHFEFLKARCWKCDAPATFSIRKKSFKDDSVVLVGGADKYTASCEKHLE